jgi:iron(III) transport system substrate-binding protein
MIRNDRRTRMRLMAGPAAVCTLALAACSSSSSSSAAAGSTATSSSAAAASSSKVTLVVYSAQGYDSAMTKAFTAFAGLDTQGLLLKGFEPNVQWNSLGTQSLPSDKSYTPTGVTLMAALAYNKDKVKTPPTTWQQLLSSHWKGQVGMNDPSQSGPTFPFVAGMMNYLGGVSAGETYFTKLKSNGLVIHPTNGPTLQALTSGQINLALVQSSAALGAALGAKNIGIAYLDPVTLLPSAIGIDAKAPAAEQAEAKQFIEFVLSPAGQKVMQSGDPTGDSLYYPVLQGVSPLSSLPSLASTKTQSINPYTWGPQEGTINTWFDSNIVR